MPGESCRSGELGAAGAMELRVDGPCRLRRQPGHALELLTGGGEKALGRAEVAEDRPAPCRTDTREPVEDGGERRGVAPAAVELHREAMCLVADLLEELEPRIVAVEH